MKRDIMFAVGVVLLVAQSVATLTGCPRPMTPQEKAVVAASAFSAEMLACVEKSPTIQESRSCRADVRTRWGVDVGAR